MCCVLTIRLCATVRVAPGPIEVEVKELSTELGMIKLKFFDDHLAVKLYLRRRIQIKRRESGEEMCLIASLAEMLSITVQ